MNVASLELCKELYKLSNWEYLDMKTHFNNEPEGYLPAYDLGYLMRKLPIWVSIQRTNINWKAISPEAGWFEADNPENAVAKLAIGLFKQGILTASA